MKIVTRFIFLLTALALMLSALSQTTGSSGVVDARTGKSTSLKPGGTTAGGAANPSNDAEVVNADQVPKTKDRGVLSLAEYQLSLCVLAFGVLCLIAVHLAFSASADKTLYTKLASSIVIITAVLFLIAANVDQQVVAPAYGLLGTVAGYILGRTATLPLATPAPANPSPPGGGGAAAPVVPAPGNQPPQ